MTACPAERPRVECALYRCPWCGLWELRESHRGDPPPTATCGLCGERLEMRRWAHYHREPPTQRAEHRRIPAVAGRSYEW